MVRGSMLGACLLTIGLLTATASAQDGRNASEGQSRPLVTEDVDLVPSGTVRLQAGFAFLQNQDFSLSGLNGDVTRIGDVGVHIGVSPNVEVQIDGTFQQFLSTNGAFRDPLVPLDLGMNPVDTQDVGDFSIATKIKITRETKRLPSFGLRFGFELPNTNQARGLGTNTTNVFAQVLAGKTFGQTRVFGNLGIAILQAPTQTFAQNDVLTYGFAFRTAVNDRVRIVGEINGRYSTRDPLPGTENRSEARLGVQVDAAGLRWDAAGLVGLSKWSPRTGIVFGFTKDIKSAFEPVIK